MTIEYLDDKNISHLERVPQIVREKQGFFNLLKGLELYIDESAEQLYGFLSQIIGIIGKDFTEDVDKNYLTRLIAKCGIKLQWYSSNLSDTELKRLYYYAINGFAIKRVSDSTKINLSQILQTLYGDNVVIEDGGLSDDPNAIMTYKVTINGVGAGAVSNQFLIQYLKPEITGVESEFIFNASGYFAAMQFDNGAEISPDEDFDESTYPYKDFIYATKFMNYTVADGEYAIYEIEEETPTLYGNCVARKTGSWMLELK